MSRIPDPGRGETCQWLLLAACLCVWGNTFAVDAVRITNAWINEAPPGMRMLAGYLDITNTYSHELTLTGATSPAFEKIEFHVTEVRDSIASMHRQETLAIPAGGTFSFSPGHYHLMLINNTRPLASGDRVSLTLIFDDHEPMTIEVVVKRGAAAAHENH